MQLEGNIKFGLAPDDLTDFSDEVSSLVVNSTIQTTTRPKTFASAVEEKRKSGLIYSMRINFFNDETDPLSFWLMAWEAQRDDSTDDGRKPGELYFTATYTTGPADPETNPEFAGWVTVEGLDTGGTVGEWKQQNQTWSVRELTKSGS